MAIPAGILDYPDIGRLPNNVTFSLVNNTTVFQSPIGGATQTLEVPGAYWRGTVSYNNLTPDQAGILNAFLVKLRGRSGRFWFGNLTFSEPKANDDRYTTDANLTTVSGNRITLSNNSWPNSLGPTFKAASAGDYIALRYRYNNNTTYTQSLHMLTSDLNVTQLGARSVTATVEPPLRRTFGANFNPSGIPKAYLSLDTSSAIDYENAVSIFRLENDQVSWSMRPPEFQSIQFSVVEAFDNGFQ